jgi:hypothetical protein
MDIYTYPQFRDAFDKILRDRGYDDWAADDALYQELLDELVDVIRKHSL